MITIKPLTHPRNEQKYRNKSWCITHHWLPQTDGNRNKILCEVSYESWKYEICTKIVFSPFLMGHKYYCCFFSVFKKVRFRERQREGRRETEREREGEWMGWDIKRREGEMESRKVYNEVWKKNSLRWELVSTCCLSSLFPLEREMVSFFKLSCLNKDLIRFKHIFFPLSFKTRAVGCDCCCWLACPSLKRVPDNNRKS